MGLFEMTIASRRVTRSSHRETALSWREEAVSPRMTRLLCADTPGSRHVTRGLPRVGRVIVVKTRCDDDARAL